MLDLACADVTAAAIWFRTPRGRVLEVRTIRRRRRATGRRLCWPSMRFIQVYAERALGTVGRAVEAAFGVLDRPRSQHRRLLPWPSRPTSPEHSDELSPEAWKKSPRRHHV